MREASGKDALQIEQVYVPIFSRSTQSRRLKRMAVFAARSYLIHAGTVQNIETKHKTLPPCSQGYLLTPEPKIDLSIQTFSSAARSIISHDNQPIPYSNFGQTDVQLREGTLVGFLEQSPVDAPESSPVYLNIAGLFQEGELVDHESDHMGDLPYIVHYPQDEEKTVEEADISDHWGPEYQACLRGIVEAHKHLFQPDLGMFNDNVEMLIPFRDEKDLTGLKQAPFSLSRRDQEAINRVLDPLVQQGRVEKVPLGQPSAAASPAFVV